MKKKNIINLIKYHAEENDAGFRSEAYEIAKEFDGAGDYQIAEYIMALMSDANTFTPQISEEQSAFLEKQITETNALLLPDTIRQDIIGIANAVSRNVGFNKFLFQGHPGTGKTEASKQLARILSRDLYSVDFSAIVDSKLGQTQKNIVSLFRQINNLKQPEKVVILFDEIDTLSMDRTNVNDLREMGRATSTILKELDRLDNRVVLIATTNLYSHFDKALVRRFDSVINFDRYTKNDLIEIAEILLNDFLKSFKEANKNIRLFRKIIALADPIPYPGELKNIIRTAVAFSNLKEPYDYFKRLYKELVKRDELSPRRPNMVLNKGKPTFDQESNSIYADRELPFYTPIVKLDPNNRYINKDKIDVFEVKTAQGENESSFITCIIGENINCKVMYPDKLYDTLSPEFKKELLIAVTLGFIVFIFFFRKYNLKNEFTKVFLAEK